MFIGITDIFKIGIGPSSSHTMGPMSAAARFLSSLSNKPKAISASTLHIEARLHGSLAFTGVGHGSDRAIFLGLLGYLPDNLDLDEMDDLLAKLQADKTISLAPFPLIHFDPAKDLVFDYDHTLPGHSNGMQFFAYDENDALILHEIYYSIGGGFVKRSDEMKQAETQTKSHHPFPFTNAKDMLEMGQASQKSIAEMQYANEISHRPARQIDEFIDMIWQSMNGCINRGLAHDGILPGGLNVRRRAKDIHDQLIDEALQNNPQPHIGNDWLNVYAMAVNEENAVGGRVVTSPTNGAAGVIPSVMRYYLDHCHGSDEIHIKTFMLTAGAIGAIIKTNASISGAEVGCQGEVGSASAMAAAGLCAALGGTNEQIENAAEIALEHHLGMTCDPAGGLVQVPCIERNGLGAIKAVSAASLALRGDGQHFIPLDNCIETMRQTGLDMHERYKETSQGGLAVNLPEC